jgi:hypothetical protein
MPRFKFRMGIWFLYALVSLITYFAFCQIPAKFDWDIDLSFLPNFINIIVAVLIVVGVIVLSFAVVCIVPILFIYVLWVGFGAVCMSRSAKKTWGGVKTKTLFGEEDVQQGRVQHTPDSSMLLDDPTEDQDDDEVSDNRQKIYKMYETDELSLEGPHSMDIRLLRLISPGGRSNAGEEQPMQFQLERRSVDEVSGKYIALSYCWGKAGNWRTIKIGKYSVKVRINLYEGLKHIALRRNDDGQLLYERLWGRFIPH